MNDDDICIVGYGCILPDAPDPQTFWANLMAGRSAIRELPDSRWDASLHCGDGPEQARSHKAAFVDEDTIEQAASRLGLTREDHTRLQIMTLAAADQAFASISGHRNRISRTGVFLGCMDADEEAFRLRFVTDELAPFDRQTYPEAFERMSGWDVPLERRQSVLFTSSVLSLLQERFGLEGEAALIDAACASSLAAIDITAQALREHRIDLGLTGGIESNLGPDTFVLFSRLGALARDRCLPFDSRSEGLSQGEGAVLFILERMGDARRLGHRILGVVGGCGASSDGTSASLFEPTSAGQLRALKEAHGNEDAGVDYIECHGTGTPRGDETELRTLQQYFGKRRVPIGSAKAVVGHTKGAAGAVGLLKCLLAMQHGEIPPSSYCSSPVTEDRTGPFLNTQPLTLSNLHPLRCGISSFGFGGINYHLVLEQPRREILAAATPREQNETILVARYRRDLSGVRNAPELRALRIPPRSLPQIDELQLAALIAVSESARLSDIDLSTLPGKAVSVVSASSPGLESTFSLSHRVRYAEFPGARERRDRHAPVTEDTGPGVLNNVIAGRVANYFDFTGPSFNVDADLASPALALWIADLRLKKEGGLLIVLAAEEEWDERRGRITRRGVECWFLASLDFAHAHNLPIQAFVNTRLKAPCERHTIEKMYARA